MEFNANLIEESILNFINWYFPINGKLSILYFKIFKGKFANKRLQ